MSGVLAFVILTLAGLPLAMFVLGLRAETIVLAPLLGAGFAAAAAAVEVGLGGPPLTLVTVALCIGFALPLTQLPLRIDSMTWRVPIVESGLLLVPALVLVWALVPLTWFRLSYDARLIWLLHARMLYAGHGTYLQQAAAFPFSHPDYPPLASSAVSFDWLMQGSISYRQGQVVIGLLTAAGTLLLAMAVGRAARVSDRLRPLVAGIVVVLCYGLWGTFATDGYTDPLVTSLVLAALVHGLFLSPGRADADPCVWLVPVIVVLGSLTKNEGFAYGVVVLVVTLGHELVRLRRTGLRHRALWTAARPDVARYAVALVAMAVWPIVVRTRGITSNLTGDGGGDRLHRLHRTLDALWHGVDATVLGFAGLIVVAVFVRTLRAAVVGFIVAVGLTGMALVLTYTFGPDPIDRWLSESIDRTDMLIRLAGLVGALWTALVAVDRIRARDTSVGDRERWTNEGQ